MKQYNWFMAWTYLLMALIPTLTAAGLKIVRLPFMWLHKPARWMVGRAEIYGIKAGIYHQKGVQ